MEKVDGNVASTSDVMSNVNELEATTFKPSEGANACDVQALTGLMIANELEKTSSAVSKPSALAKPSIMCRICLNNEEFERLLSPCRCKGTMRMVHQHCLEHWLSMSGLSHCELCLFHFATAHQLRYGMIESMRIWFSHPRNRSLLQSDILLCMLLSIVTFGLVAFSMFGMYWIATTHGSPTSQISRYWTETAIGVFLGIVLFAFAINTVVVVKANIVPWFQWWRRCKQVQLLIRDVQNP